jgi:D-inositol-3-phosphate glycosyltransferase
VRALAEAIVRDEDRSGELMLAIVGGPSGTTHGAELARIMDLAAKLGVSERVMLFPPQSQSRLADFYSAADVVLVPSRSESFGLVALEAQACGTPVVAAEVGGLRYVVDDGVSGYLVEGHDPGDHAEWVLEIIRDRALAAKMGAAAVERARRFSWDATAAGMLQVYREVVAA